jgi:hypothetical protein
MASLRIITRLSYPFLVVRKGRTQLPSFRHATLEEATSEAERRANDQPGQTYLVLQEVLRATTDPAPAPRAEEPGSMPQLLGSKPSEGNRHD